jgi:hypothetical protein
MTGCAATDNPESSPTPESSTTAQSVAEPSDYSSASPSPTPTPTGLQDSDEILEITDGIKKVTMTFSGSATVMELDGPKTRDLPEKLEYKAKQAILDSKLKKRQKLSATDVKCTADDLAIKISIAKDAPRYRPCEYPLFVREDPLFKAATQVLEEAY